MRLLTGLWKIDLKIKIKNKEFQMILECFQDGEVTTEEFIKAIRTTSMGKPFDGLPACLKTFIGAMFKTIDIDGMMGFYLS